VKNLAASAYILGRPFSSGMWNVLFARIGTFRGRPNRSYLWKSELIITLLIK